jgi:hypothetical protein
MIQFKYNQEDLELMSRDRDLVTTEIHPENDFYGQASIIRKYTGYNAPIKVVYEHSIAIHDIIWNIDKNSDLKIAFVSSKFRLEVYKKQQPRKITFNIGSVLNYAIALSDPSFVKNNFKPTEERKGSIYFPSHSTHHIQSLNDTDKIIDKLLRLPEIYKPIFACVYWKDIQNKEHEKYLQNGIKVISAGHLYDNLFYFRLFDILKNFKYVIGATFGSFVFHSARSGCIVVFPKELRVAKEEISINTKGFIDKDLEQRIKIGDEFNEKVFDLFSEPVENYNIAQTEFIEKYSSSKILSPQKLRMLLIISEIFYLKQRVFKFLKKKS